MATFNGTSGKDKFIGSADDDIFAFKIRDLGVKDVLRGEGGLNVLLLFNATPQTQEEILANRWQGLNNIQGLVLASNGYGIKLWFDNTFFNHNDVKRFIIDGRLLQQVVQPMHIYASDVTNMAFNVIGSIGAWDNINTGSGNDVIAYVSESLNSRDTIHAGAGTDTLVLAGAGKVLGVKDGPDIVLASRSAYLNDVTGIEKIVITELASDYTQTIGFANALQGSYDGKGLVSITTNQFYGLNKPAKAVAGKLIIDGSSLASDQPLHITAGFNDDKLASGAGNDSLSGGDGNDSLSAGDGNDRLIGDSGNDTLVGGKGNDTLLGGIGDDQFVFAGSTASPVTEFYQDKLDGDKGLDTLYFSSPTGVSIAAPALNSCTITGIETIGFASNNSSIAITQQFMQRNFNGAGQLRIYLDRLTASGTSFIADASGVTGKELAINFDINVQNQKETLIGGAGNDMFQFNTTPNTFGLEENPSGPDFFDKLVGGKGYDSIQVRENSLVSLGQQVKGIELLTVLADAPLSITRTEIDVAVPDDLTIDGSALSSGDNLIARGFAYDRYNDPLASQGYAYAAGRLTLLGGQGNDTLVGGLAKDTLKGNNGNDVLAGRDGADELTGGLGADWFAYSGLMDSPATLKGRDTITDFSQAQGDKIYFLHSGTAPFTFIGDADFSFITGQVRSYHDTKMTYVELDLSGDGVADLQIALTGVMNLSAADFSL